MLFHARLGALYLLYIVAIRVWTRTLPFVRSFVRWRISGRILSGVEIRGSLVSLSAEKDEMKEIWPVCQRPRSWREILWLQLFYVVRNEAYEVVSINIVHTVQWERSVGYPVEIDIQAIRPLVMLSRREQSAWLASNYDNQIRYRKWHGDYRSGITSFGLLFNTRAKVTPISGRWNLVAFFLLP